MTYPSIYDYELPRGGEWVLPDVVPFDCEVGVSDLSVLSALDSPTAKLNAQLLEGSGYELLSPVGPDLPEGVTLADDIRHITAEFLSLVQKDR